MHQCECSSNFFCTFKGLRATLESEYIMYVEVQLGLSTKRGIRTSQLFIMGLNKRQSLQKISAISLLKFGHSLFYAKFEITSYILLLTYVM